MKLTLAIVFILVAFFAALLYSFRAGYEAAQEFDRERCTAVQVLGRTGDIPGTVKL